jgi:hypothetical protein
MTQQLQVSILAAPLAAMDPRSLSQAWYSALRFGTQAKRATHSQSRGTVAMQMNARLPDRQRLAHRGTVETPLPRVLAPKRACPTAKVAVDQLQPRRLRGTLAERIERAFANPASPVKRATFSLGRGTARVHVILQTKGSSTTLLALCRPEVRVAVARALAHARAALGSRGIGVEVRALGESACS